MNKLTSRIIRLAALALSLTLFAPLAAHAAGGEPTSLTVTPLSAYPTEGWGNVLTYKVTVNRNDVAALTGEVCGTLAGLHVCNTPDDTGAVILRLGQDSSVIPDQGTYTANFNYLGDNDHAASQASLVQNIGPNTPDISIDDNVCPQGVNYYTQPMVWVMAQPAPFWMDHTRMHPTGEIWLYLGNKHVGTATLKASDAGGNGYPHAIAWFKWSTVTNGQTGEFKMFAGSRTLTAVYISNDDNFASTQSKPCTLNFEIGSVNPRHH